MRVHYIVYPQKIAKVFKVRTLFRLIEFQFYIDTFTIFFYVPKITKCILY